MTTVSAVNTSIHGESTDKAGNSLEQLILITTDWLTDLKNFTTDIISNVPLL